MRFLVDECVPTPISVFLRTLGHDVLDPRDADLRGASDRTLLEIAAREGRIIITRDLDFNLLFFRELKPAGLILLRYSNLLGPRVVSNLFETFVKNVGLERAVETTVVLRPGRVRFRPLSQSRRGESGP